MMGPLWDPELMFFKIHMVSDLVVRGGVEPPTFRFSGTGNTVQARRRGSFAVFSVISWPALYPRARG